MLIPGQGEDPGFGCRLCLFSMLHQRIVCNSSLLSTHGVISVTPFNHNVHHRGLWTEAAYGSFRVEESGVSGRLSLAGIRRFQLRARLGPPWLTYSPPSQIPPSGITAAGSSSDTPRVSPGMRDPGR
jgi:hypothetical protein